MGRLFQIARVGSIQSYMSLKLENLSHLWSEGDVTMKKWSEGYITADLEDGGRGHKPRNNGSLQKLEKARKQIPPLKPPERNQSCCHLNFTPSAIHVGLLA